MNKPLLVRVFGKTGCDKCKTLNQRLEKLLTKAEWQSFEKHYCDIMTEDGMVTFCEAECINPQRIPAMLVYGFDEKRGEYEPLPNRYAGEADPLCGASRLYQYLGLQTDYSDKGKGLLSPAMITAVLEQALEHVTPAAMNN